MKIFFLLLCGTFITAADSQSLLNANASIIAPENNNFTLCKLPSKHYPKPHDVIKLDAKRAVMHHIALALINEAPTELKKAIKFYGFPKDTQASIQRLKTSQELERFTTTREEGNYFCYKITNGQKKSLRVFFGSRDISYMQQYYASKASCKHYVPATNASDNSTAN